MEDIYKTHVTRLIWDILRTVQRLRVDNATRSLLFSQLLYYTEEVIYRSLRSLDVNDKSFIQKKNGFRESLSLLSNFLI